MMTDLTTQADADKWLARIVDTQAFIEAKKKEVVSEYKTDDPATVAIGERMDEIIRDLNAEFPAPGENIEQYAGLVRKIFNTRFDETDPSQMFVGVPREVFPLLVMRVMLAVYYFPIASRSATPEWAEFAERYKGLISLDLNQQEVAHGA